MICAFYVRHKLMARLDRTKRLKTYKVPGFVVGIWYKKIVTAVVIKV